jgi:hypothetical protein
MSKIIVCHDPYARPREEGEMLFDKATADAIIEQLSTVSSVIENGRLFEIRLGASPASFEALEQSTHPEKDKVLAQIMGMSNPYPDKGRWIREAKARLMEYGMTDQEALETALGIWDTPAVVNLTDGRQWVDEVMKFRKKSGESEATHDA